MERTYYLCLVMLLDIDKLIGVAERNYTYILKLMEINDIYDPIAKLVLLANFGCF